MKTPKRMFLIPAKHCLPYYSQNDLNLIRLLDQQQRNKIFSFYCELEIQIWFQSPISGCFMIENRSFMNCTNQNFPLYCSFFFFSFLIRYQQAFRAIKYFKRMPLSLLKTAVNINRVLFKPRFTHRAA